MNSRIMLIALAAAAMSGCLYTNIRSPREYRSATPADVHAASTDKSVVGRSCATSLLFLVAWGDEGYAAAVKDALKDDPGAVLYDVRSDIQVESYVIGIYTRVCTSVSGRVGKA
jgi:hypothetical protein